MALGKLVWAGIGLVVVALVLVGVVLAIGLGGSGLDSGGGPHTTTVTMFPAGLNRTISGIYFESHGYHILAGGTCWGNYTLSSSGVLYAYVLNPAQMQIFNTTGSVTTSLWSSLGAASVSLHYSVPATGVYYFLVDHPNGAPSGRWTVTSSLQVTLVTTL